jgi:hypothetical protein
LILLAACGGGSSTCPTADKFGGDRQEAAILVMRCKADGWSKSVIECIDKTKGDDAGQEACLRQLTKDQQDKLHAAFEPIGAEIYPVSRAETLANVDRDIAALKLDELVARAPTCADYVAAVGETRAKLSNCTGSSMALESFATVQVAQSDVAAMRKLNDTAALARSCAERAKAMRSSSANCLASD